MFEKSWVYAKDVKAYTYFVDLKKAYDRIPREKLLGSVLREYGVNGRLLLAVKSLRSCSEV